MANAKITLQEVKSVCETIINEDGIEPQVRAVRARLGVGSNGTVRRLMDEWQLTRPKPKLEKNEINPIIVKAINEVIASQVDTGLGVMRQQYKTLQDERNDLVAENFRIYGEVDNYVRDLKKLEHQLIEMNVENQHLKQQYQLLKEERDSAILKTSQLEQNNQQLTIEYGKDLEKLMLLESQQSTFDTTKKQLATLQGQLKSQKQMIALFEQNVIHYEDD